ncbi:hypothetical protein S245_060648, partial [Arachis hypogaea]
RDLRLNPPSTCCSYGKATHASTTHSNLTRFHQHVQRNLCLSTREFSFSIWY